MKTPDKPIKITPAKLDRIADRMFERAKLSAIIHLAEDLEWETFAGLALRRWAEQLRAEKKGGRRS